MNVIYKGTCDEQVNWGCNDDPRGLLVEGRQYDVSGVEVHRWHTKYELFDYPGKWFNSASFSEIRA